MVGSASGHSEQNEKVRYATGPFAPSIDGSVHQKQLCIPVLFGRLHFDQYRSICVPSHSISQSQYVRHSGPSLRSMSQFQLCLCSGAYAATVHNLFAYPWIWCFHSVGQSHLHAQIDRMCDSRIQPTAYGNAFVEFRHSCAVRSGAER